MKVILVRGICHDGGNYADWYTGEFADWAEVTQDELETLRLFCKLHDPEYSLIERVSNPEIKDIVAKNTELLEKHRAREQKRKEENDRHEKERRDRELANDLATIDRLKERHGLK